MPNNQRRKKDHARLTWSSKQRRAPNPKDIDFQTAEIVIPNPQRDPLTIAQFRKLAEVEINKTKMNRLMGEITCLQCRHYSLPIMKTKQTFI